MKRAPAPLLLPLALLPAALLYAPALGRYFVSEDFVILRVLAERPWPEVLAEQLTGPWLGVTFVKFYRPVATALLALEQALWGIAPSPYLLTHLLVHLLNAALVWRLAFLLSGREDRGVPLAAAALFALYPLHPNAVVFVASFATLFATTFLLAALVAFARFREADGRRGHYGASLAAFLLALGSYEMAAVLPALLVGVDLLPAVGRGRPWRRWAWAHAPFFALLGLYLLLRRAVFGAVLGGYENIGRRLRDFTDTVAADALHAFPRLLLPDFSGVPRGGIYAPRAAALGLLLAVAMLALGWRRGGDRRAAPLGLLALGWVGLTQAPFGFLPLVPGTGRYAYFTAVGLALALACLGRALGRGLGLPRRAAAGLLATVTLAAGLYWGNLLRANVELYARAGRLSRVVQEGLVAFEKSAPGGRPLAVVGYPRFVTTRPGGRGAPAAQVFHWGLHDALGPPFVARRMPVYPLPDLEGRELLPLLAPPGGEGPFTVLRWNPEAERLDPVLPPPGAAGKLAEIEILGTDPIAFRAPPGVEALRLVAVAAGNWSARELAPGARRARLDPSFLHTMAVLYGGELAWWLEGRDGGGQVRAASRPRWRRLGVEAAASPPDPLPASLP